MQNHIKNIIINISKKEAKVRSFYISFYIIGTIGMLIPYTFPFFKTLIPFVLIFNFLSLIPFHSFNNIKKTTIVFAGIFIAGFLVEWVGVNTGYIFGTYYYGNCLGFKLFNTPVIIGLNWLLLVYLSANITIRLQLKLFPSIIVSSLVMVFYDLVIEHVASDLNMWYWFNNSIPFKNYIAWFVIALLFHSIVKIFKIDVKNTIAPLIFTCQLLFFIVLFTYFKFFQ
jgi:putative membrane protein